MVRVYCLLLVPSLVGVGCSRSGPIEVDVSSRPICFIIDHKGWPRPFWWPRVTEFVIASDETEAGELIWHLKSIGATGELARELAFTYGRAPPGFYQVFPAGEQAPEPLERGRVYYVAAGGKDTVYRMVFSLPLDTRDIDTGGRMPVK